MEKVWDLVRRGRKPTVVRSDSFDRQAGSLTGIGAFGHKVRKELELARV